MTKEAFFLLIDKHLDGVTTDKEKQQLINFTASFQNAEWDQEALGDPLVLKAKLYEKVKGSIHLPATAGTADLKPAVGPHPPAGTDPQIITAHRVHFLRTAWFRYAAILLLLAGAATFLYISNRSSIDTVRTPVRAQTDIQPGGNKAILTLADGSAVTLDSAGQQVIRLGAAAAYQHGGKLAYTVTSNSEVMTYHTLSVPRGGQFKLELSDGTKVWLNAASSIRYPVVFEGKERKVEVTGEAYFEVAKNALAPFRVIVDQRTTVEVLGTAFNINAYRDEADIKTTLLEGSVKVGTVILQPGQQARVTDQVKVISNADLDKVIAWQKGVFNFNDADLKEVMRQLSRWYDIDVTYEKNIENIEFAGKISRSTSLNGVLKGLESTGVQFRLEGKKLTVIQ